MKNLGAGRGLLFSRCLLAVFLTFEVAMGQYSGIDGALRSVMPGLEGSFQSVKSWGDNHYTAIKEGIELHKLTPSAEPNDVKAWVDARDDSGYRAFCYLIYTFNALDLYEGASISSYMTPGSLPREKIDKIYKIRNEFFKRANPHTMESFADPEIAKRVFEWALLAGKAEDANLYCMATFLTLLFRNMEDGRYKFDTSGCGWKWANPTSGYFGLSGIPDTYRDCFRSLCLGKLGQKYSSKSIFNDVVSGCCTPATIHAEFLFLKEAQISITDYFREKRIVEEPLFATIALYDRRMYDLVSIWSDTHRRRTLPLLMDSYAHVQLQYAFLIFFYVSDTSSAGCTIQ